MAYVRDILKRKGSQVHTVGRQETVFAAIEKMESCRVGALVVVEGSQVSGMVTERDYLRKVAIMGRSSRTTRVEEIMSSPVRSCRPDDSLQQCMQTMTDERFRHLPVMEEGRLVGIVSIGDVVKQLVSEQTTEIRQLHRYIQGEYPG